MTDPRIGDTVHYTLTGPDNPCCAALVCDVLNGGQSLNLRVHEPNASISFGAHQIPYDTDGAEILYDNTPGSTDTREWTVPRDEYFTPGTWHHIH